MSKFFESLREGVKKIPSLIAKRLVHVSILGDSLEFAFPPIKQSQTIKQFLEDLIIKVNNIIVYDAITFPFEFNVKLNEKLYLNQDLLKIYDKPLKFGDKLGLQVPNRANIIAGDHTIEIASHKNGTKSNFEKHITSSQKKASTITPLHSKKIVYRKCSYCGKQSQDDNQAICEYCGSELSKS
ncbi:MAG: hypothetical protein ACW98D_05240 [Promethearchaeota archaeon]|jgi:hypothetical protein